MRVLLLTTDAPAPRHVNGGTTRQYKLFSRLLELGHDVTVVGVFAAREDPYIEELREQGFKVVPLERPKSRLREALSAVVRRPAILFGLFKNTTNAMIGEIYWVDLKSRAQQELATGDYDIFVIIHVFAAPWLDDLDTDLPAVLEVQEVESPQHSANAKRVGGLNGFVRRLAARRSRRAEQRWLPRFDAAVTMSADEAEVLKEIVGPSLPPTHVIGNGADTAELAKIGPDPGQGIVLFTGTMMFPPNSNGALWLAGEVWPRVLEQEPDARLKIVGRRPPQSVIDLSGRKGIEVTADVPEMAPYYAEADICLLPMLEGGGTRLKLTEAMAAGRAVVATTNGATGVTVTDGVELLIEDDPIKFADAIVQLLRDPELRARMAAAGRAKSIAEYDWKSLGDKYAAMLESVVAGS